MQGGFRNGAAGTQRFDLRGGEPELFEHLIGVLTELRCASGRRPNLIEQRLKDVVVTPIDQRHIGITAAE
jgi:hypothetical protein